MFNDAALRTSPRRSPPPPKTLQLDAKHPGRHDAAYVARRRHLHDLAYDYRVHDKGWPEVTYEAAEHAVWSSLALQLVEAHQRRACSLYNRGRAQLQIDLTAMPQLGLLDQRLRQSHGFGLVPAEGLLDVNLFFQYLQARRMPCTQFVRYHQHPEFTPEPDALHDVIGHVPSLMDKAYSDVVQRLGAGVLGCPKKYAMQWSRLYWFSIEFGLLQEGNETKAFGAGLLSSVAEIEHCFGPAVQRRPFNLQEVMTCKYDPTCMQQTLFVLPSLNALNTMVDALTAAQA